MGSELSCQIEGVKVMCSSQVCPKSHMTLTCSFDQAVGNNLWKLPTNTCTNFNDYIVLTQNSGTCNGISGQCGPYMAQNLASSGPCLTTSLSIVTTMTSTVSCGYTDVTGQITIIYTSTINVTGKFIVVYVCLTSAYKRSLILII